MAFVMFRVLFRTGKDVLKGSIRYNSCFCRSLTHHSSILHACTFEYILHLHLHLETGLGLRISPIILKYAFISYLREISGLWDILWIGLTSFVLTFFFNVFCYKIEISGLYRFDSKYIQEFIFYV